MQRHGADVYDERGQRRPLLDFSSSVAELPPKGWKKRLLKEMEALRHYPQPFASGLAAGIEEELGLPKASVLAGNGSSECLEWIAQSLAGKKALLEAPCFGE